MTPQSPVYEHIEVHKVGGNIGAVVEGGFDRHGRFHHTECGTLHS